MMKPSPFLLLAAALMPGCVVIDSPSTPVGPYPPVIRPVAPPHTRPVPRPPELRPPGAWLGQQGTTEYLVSLRHPRMSPRAFAAEHGLQFVRSMRSDPSQHIFRGPAGPGFLLSLRNDPSVLSVWQNSPSQNQRGRMVR